MLLYDCTLKANFSINLIIQTITVELAHVIGATIHASYYYVANIIPLWAHNVPRIL